MKITLYTKSGCPNCEQAKSLLTAKGHGYEEVNLDDPVRRANFMAAYPELRQMPQIWFGDQRVGGLAGLQVAIAKLEGAQ